nr:MAG TPA: hypothetical protein [Caudoviricetes sp.]
MNKEIYISSYKNLFLFLLFIYRYTNYTNVFLLIHISIKIYPSDNVNILYVLYT